MQIVLQLRRKDLDIGWKKLKLSQKSITKLTKTGRAIMIWFISCVACAPSYRHHPFTLCITVHPGCRPALWSAVRYTSSSHWHQSCRLCPWGCSHIRGQVQSCCWTAAIKYGHTHEWHTCSTVYYSQHKSEREGERDKGMKEGGKMSCTACLSVIQSWRNQANVDWLIPIVCFLSIQTLFLQILALEHTDIYSVELLCTESQLNDTELNFISDVTRNISALDHAVIWRWPWKGKRELP